MGLEWLIPVPQQAACSLEGEARWTPDVVPDFALTQNGLLRASNVLCSSLTSLGRPALKELGKTERAKPGKHWASILALSLPGSQEKQCQFLAAAAKAEVKLQYFCLQGPRVARRKLC